MGYRDDLIDRLREEGIWDQLTAEQQRRFESLSDDQARKMMVMDDQWGLGDQQAIQALGTVSLVQALTAFRGVLVERQGEHLGQLSQAGKLLAQFFLELKRLGLSADDVQAGLQKLSPLVIAALATVYLQSEE
jgi:hypothetical protein